MPEFIKGAALCEEFFMQAAKPILDRHYPELTYTAGLLGYGSDVLGFDDPVSVDHMWGPRFYLFLRPEEIHLREQIMETFSRELPYEFRGYSVNFSPPNPNDGGVRQPLTIHSGPVSPLLFIHTIEEYLQEYLGLSSLSSLDEMDWLSLSEHRLLALASSRFFADGLCLRQRLAPLQFYPESVRLYLLASNWAILAEEQAFVRRCAEVGDETGSILVCARIAERIGRLLFLYAKQYAPYSKWFGTALQKLPIGEPIKGLLCAALSAQTIDRREAAIVEAQRLTGELHNTLGLTRSVEAQIQAYFGRSSKVIFADAFADALADRLKGTVLEKLPLIGSISGIANLNALWDEPIYRNQIKSLYQGLAQ